MTDRADLRKKVVDVRQFKRDHVGHDELDVAGIMFGLRHGMWHKDRIPPHVVRDLQEAYPEYFPPFPVTRMGDREYTMERYEQALRDAPGHPGILVNTGISYAESKDHEKALECYERALRAAPGQPEALINMGNSLSWLGRHEEAEASFRAALGTKLDDVARRALEISAAVRGGSAASARELRPVMLESGIRA